MKDERGFALVFAIVALIVVGAIVTGTMFVGTQEQRIGENTRHVAAAFNSAESALNEVVRSWPESMSVYNAMPYYSTRALSNGTLHRLNHFIYLADITEKVGNNRQRITALLRARTPKIPWSAFTAQGVVSIGGNGAIDGTDHIPNASWQNCQVLDTLAAGVRIPLVGAVPNQSNVDGNPPVTNDLTVADSTFDNLYNQLVGQANITIAGGGSFITQPVSSGGVCNKTVQTNWGDGLNRFGPCGSYFPIVRLTGSGETKLTGVQGQGVLLVDGSLNVQGSYQFFGVVIVKGYIETSGGGNSDAHFWGTVLVKNQTNHMISISGNANFEFSKCAISQVLGATMPASLLKSRSFAALGGQ